MDEKEAFLILNMMEGIGPVTVTRLLEEYGSASAIFDKSTPAELDLFPGIFSDEKKRRSGRGSGSLREIHRWHRHVDLDKELRRIRDQKLDIVTMNDPDYPAYLREIYDPPIVLYVRGDPAILNSRALSMVGSRRTTEYGRETAARIAASLAVRDVAVVSGGARGIDTAAHWGCLNAGGRTLIILGHGMDQVYPAENRRLFDAAAENGAVVTQFPFGRRGDRQTFPVRNRIVAGMTMGTVVIEAGLSSGAMITARMAAEYGRTVFAVPGRFGDEFSEGSNQLIRDGAVLTDSLKAIEEEMDTLFPGIERDKVIQSHRRAEPDIKPKPKPNIIPPDLSPPEILIWEALAGKPMQLDEIIVTSGLPTPVVRASLLQMEMRALVQSAPGSVYSRCH